MFTSLLPAKLELNPLSDASGGGSSGLCTGSVSLFNRLVVPALSPAGAGEGDAAGSPLMGILGTLLVSSGKGLDSLCGFCAGCCVEAGCCDGAGCCDSGFDCACRPTATMSPHPTVSVM